MSVRRSERGAVLLAVVLLVAMTGAVSAALLERAASAVSEMRARRGALCARYAALGGLALGGPAGESAGVVGPEVSSLVVAKLRLAPDWCVLRATAQCRGARRSYDRTLADPAECDSP